MGTIADVSGMSGVSVASDGIIGMLVEAQPDAVINKTQHMERIREDEKKLPVKSVFMFSASWNLEPKIIK
jgi:hypothetical protein